MVGGGNRRDEGSMPIQNTNVFAALDTRKKKKSDKSKGSSKSSSRQDPPKEPQPQVFWAPTPLKAKAWADIDSDDDDDDYYVTTAPPQSLWNTSEASHSDAKHLHVSSNLSLVFWVYHFGFYKWLDCFAVLCVCFKLHFSFLVPFGGTVKLVFICSCNKSLHMLLVFNYFGFYSVVDF